MSRKAFNEGLKEIGESPSDIEDVFASRSKPSWTRVARVGKSQISDEATINGNGLPPIQEAGRGAHAFHFTRAPHQRDRIVCVPFCGSGSTLLAARNLKLPLALASSFTAGIT
jgi:hypothetical protein